LRRYKFITKRGKPQALGYTGYCGQVNCADGTHCIDEMSAAPYISSSHFSLDYVCSDTLMDAAAPYLLWQQVP